MIRVTVGMPVYNGERFIGEAIDSILNQTFEDFELIISDNASTDGTAEICRSYAERDPRVRYLRADENRGAAWNFNRLVELAGGRLFKWAAADDLHEPDHLAQCVAALEGDSTAVVAYTGSAFIDENRNKLQEYKPGWDLQAECPHERLRSVILRGGHWVNADPLLGVIRTDALRQTRLFPRYQGGDKRPIGELSLLGKFIEIPEYLLLRRHHADSSATNNPRRSEYNAQSIVWMTQFFKGSRLQVCLPTWSLMFDHLVTAWSSRLSVKDKLKLMVAVAQACRWHQHFLVEELAVVARVFGQGFRNPGSQAN